jgi:putative tryptophan/tyrosine transport system substrate-binding protein
VRRRDVIAILGATAIGWPAIAQPVDRPRRVAVLMSLRAEDREAAAIATAFSEALHALGWIEGRNLVLDQRWSEGDSEKARAQAMELAALKPDVMVAQAPTGLSSAMQAARATPIVFFLVTDPLGRKFVPSLSHPGGNVTGFSSFEFSMGGKWLQTLKEVVPDLQRVALLGNPETTPYAGFRGPVEGVAAGLGVAFTASQVRDRAEVEDALARLARDPGSGFIILPDSFANNHRELIVDLAQRHRLPAIYPFRLFSANGGLMSYGIDNRDVARRAAGYVDRILRGANPGELPVQTPTKFEFVVNLKTAHALGITMPQHILLRADEVIE